MNEVRYKEHLSSRVKALITSPTGKVAIDTIVMDIISAIERQDCGQLHSSDRHLKNSYNCENVQGENPTHQQTGTDQTHYFHINTVP